MDLIIERMTGEQYKTSDYNMIVRSFDLSYPDISHEGDRLHDFSSSFGKGRKAKAKILFHSIDSGDNILLQNEIFKIFDSRESFKLIDSRQKGMYLVAKVASAFTPEQKRAVYGEFDVDFICKDFRLSYGTSLTPLTFDEEAWQVGQGLTVDPNDYIFTTTNFDVKNIGTEEINPRMDDLVITFKGASTNLKIRNNTTGEEWQYTGTTTSGDTIKLVDVRSLKNNLSIFHNTNRKVIKLIAGNNNFSVTGATGAFTITFDLRFKYI